MGPFSGRIAVTPNCCLESQAILWKKDRQIAAEASKKMMNTVSPIEGGNLKNLVLHRFEILKSIIHFEGDELDLFSQIIANCGLAESIN